MSRYWTPVKRQGVIEGYHPKYSPHKRTAAWEEARALRASRRVTFGVHQQGRDKGGFIAKKSVVNNQVRVTMHDPGAIDRWLWMEAHKKDDDSNSDSKGT
jgi:hypothetical protein